MHKNKLLLLVLGLIFSFQISAQNDLKIGVNAGINYPDVRGHEYAKYNNFKVGYLLGISLDYYLTKSISVKTNVNYERKIRELQLLYFQPGGDEIGTKTFKDIFEYINIPILLKYEFLNAKLFINGGPFFNYLLHNKIEPNFPNEGSNNQTEQKKFDFGASLGIGTSISINEKNDITIEVRNDFGIIDTGGVPDHVEGEVKTNAFKLIVGWNLGL
ncbi:porin family protein [Mesonia ostreae]|uniref:Porin family protein n=1 Tax=Mesonia ostreae TaxID=861110 RepID=A0ABU2KGF3_9FLAO|nr:porin family protein [Mesonia ostreae]MDT0293790.1 porin family protein [Mesonia ostreae]